MLMLNSYAPDQKAWHCIKIKGKRKQFYPITIVKSFHNYVLISDGTDQYKVTES